MNERLQEVEEEAMAKTGKLNTLLFSRIVFL